MKYTDQKCPNQQFSSTAFQFIHTISKYSAIYVNCTRFSTLAKTYQLHTMPILKNRFAMCSACCLKVKKTVSRFVRSFFGRIYGAPICVWLYLTFSRKCKHVKLHIQLFCFLLFNKVLWFR